MEAVEIVPGNWSGVGRATSAALELMRSHCEFDDSSNSHAPKAPTSPTSPDSMMSPKASPTSPSGGMNLTAAFGNEKAPGDDTLTLATLGRTPTTPMSPSKMSPAFTSMGMQTQRFCNTACTHNGRWAFPSTLEQKPCVGNYRVHHGDPGLAATCPTYPEWEFGLRPKTKSLKQPSDENEKDPFATQDIFGSSISSFSAAYQSASLEQMSVKEARRPLEKSCGRTWRDPLQMSDTPDHAKAWHLHDKPSSKLWRQPEWNQAQHSSGHKTEVISNYYESQKYDVRWTCVSPKSRNLDMSRGMNISRSISHAANSGQMGHNVPKGVLHKDDADASVGRVTKKQPMALDRSMYRGGKQVRYRATNVNDFAKELSRPPLMRFQAAYHDEDDPEVDAIVFDRQMTFDAIHADHAVIPRHDHAPAMGSSLTRDRAGRGDRLFQGDHGMRASKGFFTPEGKHQISSSVEQMKEPQLSRSRSDVGVGFDQVRGRLEKSKVTTKEYGHLQQLKDATFEFERKAPSRGFDTRVAVSSPVSVQKLDFQRSRTHDALPSWAADSFDEEERTPPPATKRPGTGARS